MAIGGGRISLHGIRGAKSSAGERGGATSATDDSGGATSAPDDSGGRRDRLLELAALFLRLGLTSFGGPAAHVALMRDEFVARRGWISDHEFLDLLGAANLIPGPTSTELAIHIGHRRAGRAGLVVAGVAFILPAALIVLALAWAYVTWGTLPETRALLTGIAPVVVAIVANAGLGLARVALADGLRTLLAAAAAMATLAGGSEIAVLLGAGFVALAVRAGLASTSRSSATAVGLVTPVAAGPASAAGSALAAPASTTAMGAAAVAAASLGPSSMAIAVEFAKIGAVLFGSGYVLVALLRSELVAGLGWLTERQLLDAVAIGQVTPGPVFTTATFVGYVLGGLPGAIAATVGIFLPAFVAVAISIPVLARLRSSLRARAFLDGVNAAAFALLAIVAFQLARAAIVDVPTAVLALGSFVLLATGRARPVPLIAGGAVVGLLLEVAR